MKGKRHSIISVLLALAVVLGLVLTVAVPASANVSVAAVTVIPNTVNSAARYTVAFTTDFDADGTGALVANVDTITVTFPTGTTVPASIPANTVVVNGIAIDNVTTPAPVVTGRAVQITTPVAVAAGGAVTVVFSQAVGILNPSKATATATVSVATSAEATAVNSGAYVINATLTLSPTRGARGTSVTVTGAGYGTSLSVDIRNTSVAGNPVLGSTTSDANGVISTTITIPSTTPAGVNALDAIDGAGLASPTTNFTVTPSLTLTPTSGLAGSTVQISGSAYAANSVLAATVAGGAVVVNPAGPPPVQTTGTGAIPSIAGGAAVNTTIVIPQASTPGPKTVTVTDGAGNSASATFEVTARPLTLTPSSGPVGTRVTISAGNLTANGEVDPLGINAQVAGVNGDITIAGISWVPAATSYVIDAAGNFSAQLTIGAASVAAPAGTTSTAGAQTVVLTDSGGRIASATFTITGRSITLTPTSASAGSSILVSGSGFPISSTVILTDNTLVPGNWGSAQADASGNFVFAAANRASANAALQTITVTATGTTPAGVAVTATATYTVPAASLSLSPETGPVGTSLTVSGVGFNVSAPVANITIGGIIVLAAGSVSTDANGSFTANVAVPGLPLGATQVATTVSVGGVAVPVTRLFTVISAPQTVASVLAPLGDNLVRVWGFDAATQTWKLYDPAVPGLSDLSVLTAGQGYFIKVNAAQTLTVGTFQYNLVAGWNNIGWRG